MSIRKDDITYPDTLRTFSINKEKLKQTTSIFITPADFSFSTTNFEDADYWYTQLGTNIFPVHTASEFTPQDEPTGYKESQQDFTFRTLNGKYRHKIKYDFSLDYHQILNELSGQKIRVIYASGNTLRAELSSSTVRGFLVSAFELEKMMFDTHASSGNSELFIELSDSDDLNIRGYEVEVDWLPAQMDRLILNITLGINPTTITMLVKYLSTNVTGLSASDITITDVTNGNITFSFSESGDGIYQLNGFSDTITTACLYIQSTIYIGYKKFNYSASVVVTNNAIWSDGNNEIWSDGNNAVWSA